MGKMIPTRDMVWGGPNYDYSLTEARQNFRLYLTHLRPGSGVEFDMQTNPKVQAAKREFMTVCASLAEAPDADFERWNRAYQDARERLWETEQTIRRSQ